MENLEKREKKITSWVKNPYNATLLALLLLMLAIRLYYFVLTNNQPVWWDEGDYLNIARQWAFSTPEWDINPLRPLLFPFIVALLFKLKATEIIIRMIPFLMSILAIILTYKIGKKLYNREIGLISSIMLASFWSFTFFSYRMLVDIPVGALWLLAMFFFIKGYDENKKKYLWLFGLALMLAFLTKYTGALLGFIVIIYLLVTEQLKPFKRKDLWTSIGVAILASIPFVIYEIKKFGHPLAFYIASIGGRAPSPRPMWQTFIDYVEVTLPLVHVVFFIAFIIGLVILLFELIIGFDLLFKNQDKKLKANLLTLLTFLIPFLYLVSIGYGSYIEERYLSIAYPSMFIIGARGLWIIYQQITKYNKAIALGFIIIVLSIGVYQNLAHTDAIIKDKKVSYLQVKEAGEWIAQHSAPEDKIFALHAHAELQYASNRRVPGYPGTTPEEFLNEIRKTKPKYVVVNVFANIDESMYWKIVFPYNNPHLFKPELSYAPFIDKEQKIPILTVFSINPSLYNESISIGQALPLPPQSTSSPPSQ